MVIVGIPIVGKGIRYLEFYVQNLLKLASDTVRIYVTYHTEGDYECLERSQVSRYIDKAIEVPPYNKGTFWPSSNHSAAINAINKHANDDVLFSDYDMAFLQEGWDRTIKEKLSKVDIFGVCYAPLKFAMSDSALGTNQIQWLKHATMLKYQKLPNFSFLAASVETLDKLTEDECLTHFDKFLVNGGLPFRLINSPVLSAENNLPIGTLQWLDTGCELPGRIAECGLTYEVLEYRSTANQDVMDKSPFMDMHLLLQPEFFYLDGKPFIAHFKKGTGKADHPVFEDFKRGVNGYLDKTCKIAA